MGEEKWIAVDVDLAWATEVQIEVVDGRPSVIGLRLTPVPGNHTAIGAETLRRFPLRRALKAAQTQRGPIEEPGDEFDVQRVRGKAHPLEHYRQVASAYDLAVDAGESPTQFIQETWGISKPTAQVWIRKARDLHLIPETSRRRSSERDE